MSEWKNVTTYSQRETDRTPRSWEFRTASMTVTVHRIIHCDGWFLSCHDVRMSGRQLRATVADEAKSEAIEAVRQRLQMMMDELAAAAGGAGAKANG